MDIRDKNSVLTEWILKFAVIFFVASLFFETFIVKTMGGIAEFNIGFFIKIILIIVYGIMLSVLEKNMFKIVAFTTIIVGSVFKILVYISQKDFVFIRFTDLADYVLIISISVYYLQRHFRKTKKKKNKKKRTKHHYYSTEDIKQAKNKTVNEQ
jgi:hypothetical protein